MMGQFPETEKDKFELERSILSTLYELFGKEVDIERILIESITLDPDTQDSVIVQFSIMNAPIEKISANQALMKLKNLYGNGTTEFAERFGIRKLVFKGPAILFDKSEEVSELFQQQTEFVGETLDNSLAQYEGKFPKHAYYGCDLALEQLKNNEIVDPNLQIQCENVINNYLGREYE